MNRVWWLCAALLACGCPVAAADQTEYLKTTPKVLEGAADLVDMTSATLSMSQARRLIAAAMPQAEIDNPDFYCVVHILRWGDDPSSTDKANWYVFRGRSRSLAPRGGWTPNDFKGTRIYGSNQIGLLYVHVNVPIRKADVAARAEVRAAIEQQLIARKTTAEPATTLAAAKAAVTADTDAALATAFPDDPARPIDVESARGQTLTRVGDYLVESAYLGVSYQIDVVKKLPAPVQNLTDALGLLQSAGLAPAKLRMGTGALFAGKVYDISDVPSDVKITGKLTQGQSIAAETIDLGSKTYDNEGLYYWDVSLGIPLKTIKQVDFNAAGGTVFAKEVDQQDLFLMFNIFVTPIDTKNVQYRLIPSPLVGVALSKRPLDRIFAGGSVGLNKVQVFVGALWSRVERPATLTAGASATDAQFQSDLKGEYNRKLLVGLNVPVRQVVDFLKKSK